MPDLRILSYLPNPRVYKATIAARYSGAVIEVVGDKPANMPNWLWDYDAVLLDDAGKAENKHNERVGRTGFSGKLYKTDSFLKANPFGDIPAGFANDDALGIFESNAIMRAAARVGANAPVLMGSTPLEASRVDGFLDRTLLFAKEVQNYLLASEDKLLETHTAVREAFQNFCTAIEASLYNTRHVALDDLSLADVALACEFALLSGERGKRHALADLDREPVLCELQAYPRLYQHLQTLLATPEFAEDLNTYAPFILGMKAGEKQKAGNG